MVADSERAASLPHTASSSASLDCDGYALALWIDDYCTAERNTAGTRATPTPLIPAAGFLLRRGPLLEKRSKYHAGEVLARPMIAGRLRDCESVTPIALKHRLVMPSLIDDFETQVFQHASRITCEIA